MSRPLSPYRQFYKGSTFLAVGDVYGPQKKALAEAQKELQRTGITLEHVHKLSQGIRDDVREVFVLRQEGGIVSQKGELIALCTRQYVDDVLGEEDYPEGEPDLNIAGLAALDTAQDVLEAGTGRVVITSADRILQEIDDWRGAGTLVYDPVFLQKRQLQKREYPVVRMIMDDLIESGYFRPRTNEVDILRHHYVLDVKGILGGVSLVDWGRGNMEYARLWTGYPGNGFGYQVAAYGVEEWRKTDAKMLYALTKQGHRAGQANFFEKVGFSHLGTVRDIQNNADLPKQIRKYNVPGRNPEVYRIVR